MAFKHSFCWTCHGSAKTNRSLWQTTQPRPTLRNTCKHVDYMKTRRVTYNLQRLPQPSDNSRRRSIKTALINNALQQSYVSYEGHDEVTAILRSLWLVNKLLHAGLFFLPPPRRLPFVVWASCYPTVAPMDVLNVNVSSHSHIAF